MTLTHACDLDLHDRCLKNWCTCTCHPTVPVPDRRMTRLWRWLTDQLETGPVIPTRRERWPQ